MGRAPCCEKDGLKKGPWTPEEDQKLINFIQKYGKGNWRTLPKNAGLQRCGKSCRLRWTNYLRPDIKRGRFSFEEEETIIQLHGILGNKWSTIAAHLPGRTDNEIKNYWNTNIRKRLLRMGIDPVTHSPRLDLSSFLSSSLYNSSDQLSVSQLLGIQTLLNPELLRLSTNNAISSQGENSQFLQQNPQEHQFCNPQTEDQFPSFQPNQLQTQEIQACTTSIDPFLNEIQLIQPNVQKQFQSNPTDFSSHSNMWQGNTVLLNLKENSIDPPNYSCYNLDQFLVDSLTENSNVQTNNSNQNSTFASVVSTSSSSSPTTMNSSSMHINSSTEDERDSNYCSNMLKFEIPDNLDINEFMF